jgi:predicted transcriptional regulator of viral defense system
MTSIQESKLRKIGLFSLAQAKELGIEQPHLSRLVKKGIFQRVARGFYLHPHAKISSDAIEFQIACAKFGPESAIAGLSALFHYRLIEQVPTQTWILVPPHVRSKERGYRLMRTKSDSRVGVNSKKRFNIVSLERALIEGLKFSSKIGERTALKAVRTALSTKQTTEAKLGKTAKELGLQKVLEKYFEAIAS